MIELYAITDSPPPALPDAPRLVAVGAGGLAAVCAPANDDGDDLSPERLWRHAEVVESLMAERDLLPVRYGTRLEDEAAAARTLETRHGELVDALDRVRGAVELSVRVAGDPATDSFDSAAESGADYMRARARTAAARERARRDVHEPLSSLARESVERPAYGTPELLRGAYLVDRDAVGGFVRLVAHLERAHPALRMLCTGPWAPYSFAGR
ncbi:MAG TPA: GvpL/GvpF family gas vesicle protein [Thermoleophilaceae bacterium]|nr:GvpL/GvpF family gas vesicle protein [Thermoleophilaceae bacterium]